MGKALMRGTLVGRAPEAESPGARNLGEEPLKREVRVERTLDAKP